MAVTRALALCVAVLLASACTSAASSRQDAKHRHDITPVHAALLCTLFVFSSCAAGLRGLLGGEPGYDASRRPLCTLSHPGSEVLRENDRLYGDGVPIAEAIDPEVFALGSGQQGINLGLPRAWAGDEVQLLDPDGGDFNRPLFQSETSGRFWVDQNFFLYEKLDAIGRLSVATEVLTPRLVDTTHIEDSEKRETAVSAFFARDAKVPWQLSNHYDEPLLPGLITTKIFFHPDAKYNLGIDEPHWIFQRVKASGSTVEDTHAAWFDAIQSAPNLGWVPMPTAANIYRVWDDIAGPWPRYLDHAESAHESAQSLIESDETTAIYVGSPLPNVRGIGENAHGIDSAQPVALLLVRPTLSASNSTQLGYETVMVLFGAQAEALGNLNDGRGVAVGISGVPGLSSTHCR